MDSLYTKSILMEDLSWTEIEAAISHGYDTVLIGFGAMEQHGPHLPISTDTITAKKICELVACRTKKTLVAPTLTFGSSVIHRFFPGTIDINHDILFDYVKEYCSCLKKHGFKHLVIIPTHGGNFQTAERISAFFANDPCNIYCAYDGNEFIQFMRKLSIQLNIPQPIAGTHSGEMETSIYMYLTNNINVIGCAETGFCGDYDSVREEGLKKGMGFISPNGIIGDAKQASYEKGKFYVDNLVDFIVSKVMRCVE